MKDMNEKNIKLEEEFKKLKNEWLQEAKKILETEYPRRLFKWQNFKRNII